MSDRRRISRVPQIPAHDRDDEKLTVRVPAALLSRIDVAALERGVGRSEFVRQALVTHTDEVLGPSHSDAEPTLYEILKADGAIGRFTGPRDLSFRDRHDIRERIRARVIRAAGVRSTHPRVSSKKAG